MRKKLLFYISMGLLIVLTSLHGSEWIKNSFDLRAYHEDNKAYYYESIAFESKLKAYIQETFEAATDKEEKYGTYQKIVESPNYGFYIVINQYQEVRGYAYINGYEEVSFGEDDVNWLKPYFESQIDGDSYQLGFDRREEAEVQSQSQYLKKVLEQMMGSYPQVEAFGVAISNELEAGDAFYTIYRGLQQDMKVKEVQLHKISKWLIVELSMVVLMVIGMLKRRLKLQPIKHFLAWLTNRKYYQVFFCATFICYVLGSGGINWMLLEAVKTGNEGVTYFFTIVMVVWQGLALYIVVLCERNISYVRHTLKDMVLGVVDGKREVPTKKLVFNQMLQEMTLLSYKMTERATEIGRSEKLKTELLMGVARNLETPILEVRGILERLGTVNIQDETAKEYISIIDERTHRFEALLKELIEVPNDMEEGSEVHLETIELYEIVGTVVEQYKEKFQIIPLEVCMDECIPTLIEGDMKFLWRILENLIGNVIKYAMPHSRVYVHIKEEDGYGIIIIKNMCKDRIEREAWELKERFVRGDRSRTTEGFGLGLAIVENLVIRQKGKMDLAIDGDLFKVRIALPLSK